MDECPRCEYRLGKGLGIPFCGPCKTFWHYCEQTDIHKSHMTKKASPHVDDCYLTGTYDECCPGVNLPEAKARIIFGTDIVV